MARERIQIITGASVILPDATVSADAVVITDQRITQLSPQSPASLLLNRDDVELVDGSGCYLTPGLIDLQMNGAFGIDCATVLLPDIEPLFVGLPRHGVTGFLATLTTAPTMDLLAAQNRLEQAMVECQGLGARMLGIHLEGPFLNPQYRGTHPASAIVPPTVDAAQALLSPSVRMMTLAPEYDPEQRVLRFLQEQGIVVSAGHTGVTAEQLRPAFRAGLSLVTHLFNAMPKMHHREPGLIPAVLQEDGITIQLIADGFHVHPDMIGLAVRMKPISRVILTSDAMPLAGLPDGSAMPFAGQQVTSRGGQAINEEGHLAGSVSLLDQCVRNIVRWGILSFPHAIQTVTRNPAQVLGQDAELGVILPGAQADLVLWDKDTLAIRECWAAGRRQLNRYSIAAPA